MKTLGIESLDLVSGGRNENQRQSDVVSRGLELCKGFPDDKEVTIRLENTTQAGVPGTNGGTKEVITFTLTCGELRDAAKASGGRG
ncbi:hypothetical protein Psesu_1941 [Pseudoxanthomonas suwonensis 11-1]|uniref:Uncharacterized protein n=1 Tax=Pseudoxanthomonas suwonensis (strain 11-1) TaxID=743721 RepID=E6WU58_PSEUU|nr:hypothetical protein [Pseudoxanthomonas suwonensis]ADV27778.1 hypothetical protein Psesu_1941 [Pseudoxanthomonas suwonensis 11-1]